MLRCQVLRRRHVLWLPQARSTSVGLMSAAVVDSMGGAAMRGTAGDQRCAARRSRASGVSAAGGSTVGPATSARPATSATGRARTAAAAAAATAAALPAAANDAAANADSAVAAAFTALTALSAPSSASAGHVTTVGTGHCGAGVGRSGRARVSANGRARASRCQRRCWVERRESVRRGEWRREADRLCDTRRSARVRRLLYACLRCRDALGVRVRVRVRVRASLRCRDAMWSLRRVIRCHLVVCSRRAHLG